MITVSRDGEAGLQGFIGRDLLPQATETLVSPSQHNDTKSLSCPGNPTSPFKMMNIIITNQSQLGMGTLYIYLCSLNY